MENPGQTAENEGREEDPFEDVLGLLSLLALSRTKKRMKTWKHTLEAISTWPNTGTSIDEDIAQLVKKTGHTLSQNIAGR